LSDRINSSTAFIEDYMGNWQATVFDYCERRDGGLWAEPLNASTNAAFLLAAAAAFVLWRRRPPDYPTLALILVSCAIGLGSFAFHTLATPAAMLLDVAPIAVFIYAYFFLAFRRFLGLQVARAAGATLLFALASRIFSQSVSGLNGSVAYLPALGALIFLTALLLGRRRRNGPDARQSAQTARLLAAATSVFAASLFFRTVDRAVCNHFCFGTHFIWHVLNAVTIWLLLSALIRHQTPLATSYRKRLPSSVG
jgi:hypothetical protein